MEPGLKDPFALFEAIRSVEDILQTLEDLMYEHTIILAQAQCFDFLREIDKREGRVLEELMTPEKEYACCFIHKIYWA